MQNSGYVQLENCSLLEENMKYMKRLANEHTKDMKQTVNTTSIGLHSLINLSGFFAFNGNTPGTSWIELSGMEKVAQCLL